MTSPALVLKNPTIQEITRIMARTYIVFFMDIKFSGLFLMAPVSL
jgi:hypothetical protein